MFKQLKYIRNSFNIVFARQKEIRRRDHEFENKLRGLYFQPHIIPIPDDLDPEMPRIIFGSEHGFSQIIISQVNLVLNVLYSPDWQNDIEKGKKYLIERTPKLFELLELLENPKPHFCGLTTLAYLPVTEDDLAILSYISSKFLKPENSADVHDLLFKTTFIVDNKFFSNIEVQNYRSWKRVEQEGIPPLSRKEATERGVQIVGDFNDRYAFNEEKGYTSSPDIANIIIEKGFDEIKKMIMKIRGDNS